MMFKILQVGIFILFVNSCSTFHWQPVEGRTPYLPYTFDQSNILGNGLKISDQGYRTINCLKSFKSRISRGILDLKFIRVDDKYKHHDLFFNQFIKNNLEKVKLFNLYGKKSYSFVLTIKIKDRLKAIQEETIKFRDDIRQLIENHQKEQFYKACGTEYISTTTFDNEIYFFFSYYPQKDKEAQQLEFDINKSIEQDNDIFKIQLFKNLTFESDSYFSLYAVTSQLMYPLEFPFQKYHGKNIDVFLNNILTSVVNSNYGRITKYSSAPWSNLNAVRSITPLSGSFRVNGYTDEAIYKSILLLESSVRQFNIWNKRVREYLKKAGNEEQKLCQEELNRTSKFINWQNFQSCKKTVLTKQSIDLAKINECQPLTSAIADLNKSQVCLFLNKNTSTISVGFNNIDFELTELKDHIEDNKVSLSGSYIDHRFEDEKQYKNIPVTLPLGTGADINGNLYRNSCIIEDSKQYAEKHTNRMHSVTNDYFPVSVEEWFWLKKLFLFWEDSPKWTRFRGSFEIKGLSKSLNPDFKLAPEMVKLSKENLTGFLKRCGTHYIRQMEHRRGFVYYFEPNAPEETEVEIITYGLAPPSLSDMVANQSNKKVKDSQDKCELCFEIPDSGESADFDLPNIKTFFQQKQNIMKLFKSDRVAIPSRLSLVPWTDYLLNRGYIDQQHIFQQ